jgi:endonuclease VIII
VAEGDTILRLARRIDAALAGEELAVEAPHRRGKMAGVTRLEGCTLHAARSHGKHLLLDFGDLVLHSHLGMSGTWDVYGSAARRRRPPPASWAVLRGSCRTAVQIGGPTLRVMRAEQVRRDPTLARLGPDILADDLDQTALVASLRGAGGDRPLGEALIDQTRVAGIGNIFKSEGCFAAGVSPWRPVAGLDDGQLAEVLAATRRLMRQAVAGRKERSVYRRSREPCPACGSPIRSRGQGDANRTTYWCPRCQP